MLIDSPALIDSHCHLNYKGLVEQQGDVLARARAAGVTGMLTISTRAREWPEVVAIAEAQNDVWASIGVHPHEVDTHADLATPTLIAAAAHPKVIGIGETGLDYYYDHSDRAMQAMLFRRHCGAARATGLPLIIHTREAEADTLTILEEELGEGGFPALIHCFTASAAFAREVLALGLSISLSGILTFKNSKDLQSIAATIPEDRLLVETDSPFLAPVPHRGQVCEPAFVADTLRCLADLRGATPEALAATTSANFFRLFTKAQAPAP